MRGRNLYVRYISDVLVDVTTFKSAQYIFQLEKLDLGGVAMAMGLLKLPRMPWVCPFPQLSLSQGRKNALSMPYSAIMYLCTGRVLEEEMTDSEKQNCCGLNWTQWRFSASKFWRPLRDFMSSFKKNQQLLQKHFRCNALKRGRTSPNTAILSMILRQHWNRLTCNVLKRSKWSRLSSLGNCILYAETRLQAGSLAWIQLVGTFFEGFEYHRMCAHETYRYFHCELRKVALKGSKQSIMCAHWILWYTRSVLRNVVL